MNIRFFFLKTPSFVRYLHIAAPSCHLYSPPPHPFTVFELVTAHLSRSLLAASTLNSLCLFPYLLLLLLSPPLLRDRLGCCNGEPSSNRGGGFKDADSGSLVLFRGRSLARRSVLLSVTWWRRNINTHLSFLDPLYVVFRGFCCFGLFFLPEQHTELSCVCHQLMTNVIINCLLKELIT